MAREQMNQVSFMILLGISLPISASQFSTEILATSLGNPSYLTTDGTSLYVWDDGTGNLKSINGQHKVRTLPYSFPRLGDLVAVPTGLMIVFDGNLFQTAPEQALPEFFGSMQDNEDPRPVAEVHIVYSAELGVFYATDWVSNRIRRIDQKGVGKTFAGSSVNGFRDGAGLSAQFSHPNAIAISKSGDLIVNDACNKKLRKISPDAQVTTLASTESIFTGCALVHLVVLPDNTIVGAEHAQSKIFRFTGQTTEPFADVATFGFSDIGGMALVSDNAIVFSDFSGHKIGRLEFTLNKPGVRLTARKAIQLQWQSEVGKIYSIESSPSAGSQWTRTVSVQGTGSVLTQYFPASDPQLIYRVVEQ